MINKQFDLNKFYAQSAKMSDFLKGKGHNIPRTTLFHGLSVMMGEKNWNTLKPKLDLPLEQKNSKEQLLSVSNAPVNGAWDKDAIIIFNEIFNKNKLIECIESLFKYPESYPRYNIDDIYDYEIFETSLLSKKDLFVDDAISHLDDPSFLSRYLKITDYNNDINMIYSRELPAFDSFIDGQINGRKLIGDELFFRFSFHFDLNNSRKENSEKILTAILFQHALSSRNTYSNDFFVRHPLVRVNCRGNRVKVSIFAFINMDYSEEMDGGFFKMPSFFEHKAFMHEGDNSIQYDPKIKIKTLYNHDRFEPDIAMTSLNNRELCHKIFTKN